MPKVYLSLLSHHTLQDDNGFYTGQVGEAFGLVPSNFIQKEEKKETMSTKQAVGETKEIEKWYVRIYSYCVTGYAVHYMHSILTSNMSVFVTCIGIYLLVCGSN